MGVYKLYLYLTRFLNMHFYVQSLNVLYHVFSICIFFIFILEINTSISHCFSSHHLHPSLRLFSHVDDPFLDDPLPREFVLYLRPSGPLQNQLSHFWQQSRVTCGKNKAHNIFPHITLCQFFMVSSQHTPGWPERTFHVRYQYGNNTKVC